MRLAEIFSGNSVAKAFVKLSLLIKKTTAINISWR